MTIACLDRPRSATTHAVEIAEKALAVASRTVVTCAMHGPQTLNGHEASTRAEIARRLARLAGFEYGGEHDPDADWQIAPYFVPSDTLTSTAAARLGIGGADDLFGGVVPASCIATKAITHPLVDADAVAPANRSLTTEAIALLREVNRELDGRLTPREHARLVKRDLAEGRLSDRPGTPPRTPASLADVLAPAAASWGSEIGASRHPVHGSLDDLKPVLAGPGDPHPDDVPPGVPDPAEVADLVREVLRRADSLRVDSGHEGTGNTGRAAAPARSRARRLRRRLGLDRD